MRATRLEIDCKKFQNNIKKIIKYSNNKDIMPVIKANAYGTYINKKKNILKQFPIVATALVEEGIKLREIGYENEILILNQPSIHEIDEIVENTLTIGISSKEFLKECIKRKVNFKVHLEIETGMNRTGIKIEELEKFISLLKESNLIIEGIYTHLSSADYDEVYTLEQIKKYEKALYIIEKQNIEIKYSHVGASNGLLNYQLPYTNLIRPGLLIYGYEPYPNAFRRIKLEPITKLRTEITYIKTCKKDEKIGYSQTYTCKKDMVIATIPIGYADGYRRELSNKGYVFIQNKKAPIVGTICMDSCMIDVTNIDCKIGDEVLLWDNKNITVEDLAKICNTINYELLSTISDRVPRVFIEEKES